MIDQWFLLKMVAAGVGLSFWTWAFSRFYAWRDRERGKRHMRNVTPP